MVITVHSNATVLQVNNNAVTTLSAGIDATQTTIPLTTAAKFSADGGYAVIEESSASPINEEVISYSGKSGNTLTGVVRAEDGSTAMNGSIGDVVSVRDFAQHHNVVATAAITTSTQLAALASGAECFSALCQVSAGSGSPSYTSDFGISGTTPGDTQIEYDKSADGSRLQIGIDQVEANQRAIFGRDWEGSAAGCEFAGRMMLYTDGNMQVAAEQGVLLDPGVADAGGAVGFLFKTINDIATGDGNLVVQNQATPVLIVTKTETSAPRFVASAAAGLNLTVGTGDPGAPVNGDVWLINDTGASPNVTEIRCRMGGVTYAVAVA